MLTRQQLMKAATSLARYHHETNRASYSSDAHHGEGVTVTEPSEGGWRFKFDCSTEFGLPDSDIVLRALVLQALEAE